MFFIVLRRLYLSLIYVGQWSRKCAVDSISKPQLKPSRSVVIKLTPLGLWQLKRLLAEGLINFRIFFLILCTVYVLVFDETMYYKLGHI